MSKFASRSSFLVARASAVKLPVLIIPQLLRWVTLAISTKKAGAELVGCGCEAFEGLEWVILVARLVQVFDIILGRGESVDSGAQHQKSERSGSGILHCGGKRTV